MLAPGARLGRVADHAPRILRGAVALRSHAHSGEAYGSQSAQQGPHPGRDHPQLGSVEAVKFKGVDPLGSDQYHVTFEHGAAEFTIRLGPDGKIVTAAFEPSP